MRFRGFLFTGKISSIRTPSQFLLVVCQDEQTLDDGVFKPAAANWLSGTPEVVAARHESKYRPAKSSAADTKQNVNSRGNVGFCDGHVEFLSRKDALSQKYSGSATPDPPGF